MMKIEALAWQIPRQSFFVHCAFNPDSGIIESYKNGKYVKKMYNL